MFITNPLVIFIASIVLAQIGFSLFWRGVPEEGTPSPWRIVTGTVLVIIGAMLTYLFYVRLWSRLMSGGASDWEYLIPLVIHWIAWLWWVAESWECIKDRYTESEVVATIQMAPTDTGVKLTITKTNQQEA